jgi:hypothetical protein
MKGSLRRCAALAVISLVALLAVGATTASANHGSGVALRVGVDDLVTQAANQLGINRTRLGNAIVNSALARINDALADGDIDADDVAAYRTKANNNLRFAYAVSRTRTVASNLGITTTRLNTAFRAARKVVLLARISAALTAGQITADQATTLRQRVNAASLPGYKYGVGYG